MMIVKRVMSYFVREKPLFEGWFKRKYIFPSLSILLLVLSLPLLLWRVRSTTETRQFASGSQSGYHQLATYHAMGPAFASLVGPGVDSTKEKFYITYQYVGGTFDLVAIDPNDGYKATAYKSPVPTEFTGATITVGSDNNLYIASKSTVQSHIFKFITSANQLVDIGVIPKDPVSNKLPTYISGATKSPIDSAIYGCTYPSADLYKYNPSDPVPSIVNLGSVDSSNEYARYCVADQQSPYIYVSTGTNGVKVIAYNIQTQAKTVLLTDPAGSFDKVWLGSDGNVYTTIGTQSYALHNGTAAPVAQTVTAASTNKFANGDTIAIDKTHTQVFVNTSSGAQTYPYTYAGGEFSIYRVGPVIGQNLYMSTGLPFYLTKFAVGSTSGEFQDIGTLGSGEAYSFLPFNNKLAITAYGSGPLAPMMMYDPSQPLNPADYSKVTCSATGNNPECVSTIANLATGGETGDLRAESIVTVNGSIYAGSVGHYGQVNGPLVRWDPTSATASAYYPYTDQGIHSLTTARNCVGMVTGTSCIVGGSTRSGGGGSTPIATTSHLFLWNPSTNRLITSIEIPSITGVTAITDLLTDANRNIVYGIAYNGAGSVAFAFNPTTGRFLSNPVKLDASLSHYMYESAGWGSDGNIWGLTASGVFKLSPISLTASIVESAPVTITGGFSMVKDAVNGDKIYFASNSHLYSYTAPVALTATNTPVPLSTNTPSPSRNTPTPTSTHLPTATPTKTNNPNPGTNVTKILKGRVYVERNGQAGYQNGDLPIVGDRVTISSSNGKVYPVTTSASGTYLQYVTAPATYTITVTKPDGYSSVAPMSTTVSLFKYSSYATVRDFIVKK